MNLPEIHNFRVRANYPNFTFVRFLVDQEIHHKEKIDFEGYLPPEVEYTEIAGEEAKTLQLRLLDQHFLMVNNKEDACQYLRMILAARNGDRSVASLLNKMNDNFLRERTNYYEQTNITENEYLVPSISRRSYTNRNISHKGTMLLELTQNGYPIPDFCILTAQSYLLDTEDRENYISEAISNLEKLTGQQLGNPENPLIFAVRTAMPQYIPGLMPTYLNVGVSEEVYQGLIRIHSKSKADKIFLNMLKSLYEFIAPEDAIPNSLRKGFAHHTKERGETIEWLVEQIRAYDPLLLTDAMHQCHFFIKQSDDFFTRNEDLLFTFLNGVQAYPSIILQKMVWTVGNSDCYPGVLYSRHSRTGLGVQIESVRDIFGEDIMTGSITSEDFEYFNRAEIKDRFPAIYHFHPLLPMLEKKLKSPATIEFAAESFSGHASFFAILQLNDSELTGRAALLSTMDLYEKGHINKQRVLELIHPYHLRQIFSERIDDRSYERMQVFSKAFSILPRSAVSAKVYFSAAKAIAAKRQGEKVCLCKDKFVPEDTIILGEMDAIISLNPAAIHVVTACRGYGIPAFLNLQNFGVYIDENSLCTKDGLSIKEGDWVTLSSKHQILLIGKARFRSARFIKYLEGAQLDMNEKEERVFKNLAHAYNKYQDIVNSLETGEIVELNDLVKIIRNDMRDDPNKAASFVNNWFDDHIDHYLEQILKSELGSHQDQHRIYNYLTTNRQVRFFKEIILLCEKREIKGFLAGSFMLGRFLSQRHPVQFWKCFSDDEISFLINEHILFEKYLQVLYEVGEQHINRARNKILNEGLWDIEISNNDAKTFMTLKLAKRNWSAIEAGIKEDYCKEVSLLVKQLQKPYGHFYNYKMPWSLKQLKELCILEKIGLPSQNEV